VKIFAGSTDDYSQSFLHVGYLSIGSFPSSTPEIDKELHANATDGISLRGQTTLAGAVLIVGLGITLTCKIQERATRWLAIGLVVGMSAISAVAVRLIG